MTNKPKKLAKRFSELKLSPTHPQIKSFFTEISNLNQNPKTHHEQTIKQPLYVLLKWIADQIGWTFLAEVSTKSAFGSHIRPDGMLRDPAGVIRGYLEAKDDQDDLWKAKDSKVEDSGYPEDNMLYWQPKSFILVQQGKTVLEHTSASEDSGAPSTATLHSVEDAEKLIEALKQFFDTPLKTLSNFEQASAHFYENLPLLSNKLTNLIGIQLTNNPSFQGEFKQFEAQMQNSINPTINKDSLIEMLVQHELMRQAFEAVYDQQGYVNRNPLGKSIQQVMNVLTEHQFNRNDFFKETEGYYQSLKEATPSGSQKHHFLVKVYETFFRHYSVDTAEVMGVVYTPSEVVQFMLASVNQLLSEHFGTSLYDKGVHVLDPFSGTGTFLQHLLDNMSSIGQHSALQQKYKHELHANELLLLPYYISVMGMEALFHKNIKGDYVPFEGMCLVDTFRLGATRSEQQMELLSAGISEENVVRIKAQEQAPIMVIIGNPPYHAHQEKENDGRKNLRHPALEQRIRATYGADSVAQNKQALQDPYVKAFRWATDRLKLQQDSQKSTEKNQKGAKKDQVGTGKDQVGTEKNQVGIVAFISNHSFVDGFAFDGMRKCLAEDFDALYHLDLGGNMRQSQPLAGKGNIFGIRVGVGITFGVYNPALSAEQRGIFYAHAPPELSGLQKLAWLNQLETLHNPQMEWQRITLNTQQLWLHARHGKGFDALPAFTDKKEIAKYDIDDPQLPVLFHRYSNGLQTNRDAWCWNYSLLDIRSHMKETVEHYNRHVRLWPSYWEEHQQSFLQRAQYESWPVNQLQSRAKNLALEAFIAEESGLVEQRSLLTKKPDERISWSEGLKKDLLRGRLAEYNDLNIRDGLYRPFCPQKVYFDIDNFLSSSDLARLNHRTYQLHHVFPDLSTQMENAVICVPGAGGMHSFYTVITNHIPDQHLVTQGTLCFPRYWYETAPDGTRTRLDNLTDWGLNQFKACYGTHLPKGFGKDQLFHYIYGALHHAQWRERYAENMRHSLPRIAWALPEHCAEWVEIGEALHDLHLNFRSAKVTTTKKTYVGEKAGHYGVDQSTRWLKGAQHTTAGKNTLLQYNQDIQMHIPPEVHQYRLGNHSALEWVVNQHAIKWDKRSGIVNNPNQSQHYDTVHVHIEQMITVSLETIALINRLGAFPLE